MGARHPVPARLLVTLAAFRMTRSLATTNPDTNVFAVIPTQRDAGAELFAQGNVTSAVSIRSGATHVDAKLLNTGVIATNDNRVVGVSRVKTDVSIDYHPAFAPGFALTGSVHAESKRAATNTNHTFAPAYATFDIGARYSTQLAADFVTLRFQVFNATDKQFYSAAADGNIVGSPRASTARLGAPRTSLASLEIDVRGMCQRPLEHVSAVVMTVFDAAALEATVRTRAGRLPACV
ncbi:MAG: TonB-dependent receptor [Rhodanobacter sp.]